MRVLFPGWPASVPLLWFACLVWPWLNAYARGPSAAVQPWLVSALCALLLAAVHGFGRLSPLPVLVLAALCVSASVSAALSLDLLALFGACTVILVAAATAAAGARRAEFVRAMALAWLGAAVISSVIALCQYFGWTQPFEPWMSAASLGEAYANLRQRNQFASLTSIGLVALMWFVQGGLKPGAAFPLLALLAAGNAASASRTGAVQWLLVMVLAVATLRPRKQVLFLCSAGAVTYLGAALVLPGLLESISGVAGPSVLLRFGGSADCSSRAVLWSNVGDLIARAPWFGWGWGELDFAHYMTLYGGDRFCDILDNAHSLPLHIAVEAGIPAALLVCGGAAWAMWRGARTAAAGGTELKMAWAVMAVILVHSLLEYPLWYGPFQIAFGLCVGLLWGAPRPGAAPRWPVWAPRLLVVVPALLALAYAAWDYRRISQIYLPPEARAAAYEEDTLRKLQASRLFANQVRFAELTLTPLTRDNAQWTFDTSRAMLHYSPEPRVIEKLIESAMLLGREDEAAAHLRRFRAAFAEEHAAWAKNPAARP